MKKIYFLAICFAFLFWNCNSDQSNQNGIHIETENSNGESHIDINDKGVAISASSEEGQADINVDENGVKIEAGNDGANANITVGKEGVNISAGNTEIKNNTIQIDGTGLKKTISCNGERIEINGAGNNILIKGKASFIEINGAANVIHVEQVESLDVTGMGNKVFYRELVDGKKPNISKSGLSIQIEQKNF